MEREVLLEHLKAAEGLSESLYHTLLALVQEVNLFVVDGPSLPIFTVQLLERLVPLCCERHVQRYYALQKTKPRRSHRHNQSVEATQSKGLLDQVADLILIALLKVTFDSQAAAEQTVDMIMDHIDRHQECTNLYVIFLRLLQYCPFIKAAAKQHDAASLVVSYLEKTCAQADLPESIHPPSKRQHMRNSSEGGPFIKQATTVQAELKSALNRSIIAENGESFALDLPSNHGYTATSRVLRRFKREKLRETPSKVSVVPLLNLQPNLNESFRSSRRGDPSRSVSGRSAQFSPKSGSWGEVMSPMTASRLGKETKTNISQIIDFETSFIAEESSNLNDYMTASEKLRNLATELGEACLTADLTALIAHKRDNELEKVAKATVIPSAKLPVVKDNKREERSPDRPRSHSMTSLTNLVVRKQIAHGNLQALSEKKPKRKGQLRVVQMNLLKALLELYEPIELQYVRSPVNILFSHLLSKEFSTHLTTLSFKSQEGGDCSDDDSDLYDEEQKCAGLMPQKRTSNSEELRLKKEEYKVQPKSTVPGMSPRGAKPMQWNIEAVEDTSMSFKHEASLLLQNDDSQLELACFQLRQERPESLLKSEKEAVFSILRSLAQYTEEVHKHATTPDLQVRPMMSSESQYYDFTSMSPKKPRRTPNASLAASLLQSFEDQKEEHVIWMHGVGWTEANSREKLRKKSDLFLWRLSRRLIWAEEKLLGPKVADCQTQLLQLLATYTKLCATRISFLQVIDLVFEPVLAIKRKLVEGTDFHFSRPPSPSNHSPAPKALGFACLQLVSEMLLQARTKESYKLLSDVFVSNDAWQEVVKSLSLHALGETVRQEARIVVKYLNSTAIFLRHIVNDLRLDRTNAELNSSERTWKTIVRRSLNSLSWLTSPHKGLIPRYLSKHSPDVKITSLHVYSLLPRTLPLMKSVLRLLTNLFWFSPRFSTCRSLDHALFYIRMHYVSFLKLYTSCSPERRQEAHVLNATVGNHFSATSATAKHRFSEMQRGCWRLCSLHLMCLFAFARNRSVEITRKFYQFRIVEFLTREFDLECDVALRREKFLQLRKQEKQKYVKVPPKAPEPAKSLSLKLDLGSMAQKKPVMPALKLPSLKEEPRESQLTDKKPKVPALQMNFLTQDPEQKEKEKQDFVDLIVKQEDDDYFGLTKLEKSLNKRNPKMQLGLDLGAVQAKNELASSREVLQEPEFYERERLQREVYCDDELHVSMLGLVFCLLLTPTRGTLEESYCLQYPINNGKPNVLFMLHSHLNHPSNQHILPRLAQLVSHIVPPLAGQRLLKLLCTAFFNSNLYTGWRKIATGAYGTVYACETGLSEPATVAIKKMSVPKSIYDRSVLHDIFTEIASLEEFRLERYVTDLYDYGVDENDYYIVMKHYSTSLKAWRDELPGPYEDYLHIFLTLFREVLKSVQIIHKHNVTHYDLKCDNFLLDGDPHDCRVTLGDFGECRMFINAEDELCLRNKGTEYIKSPEMLILTIAVRKENDKYDRRRKIGTSRASDIWSLGCLLYELLTGEFLFYNPDWAQFYICCTSPNVELLSEERLDAIHHNVYLTDFLRFMLVRDPRHRPTINSVLDRFEHLHALLVSAPMVPRSVPHVHTIPRFSGLKDVLEACDDLIRRDDLIVSEDLGSHLIGREELQVALVGSQFSPAMLRITQDVSLCSAAYLEDHLEKIVSLGFTHLVYCEAQSRVLERFYTLQISSNSLKCLASVLDFLRHCQISRGRVLFAEGEDLKTREVLLVALSEIFNTHCYETWSFVNCQSLFFNMPQSVLSKLSSWTLQQSKIKQCISSFPRFQCLCGCVSLILKRHMADPERKIVKNCSCSLQYRNVDTSECPSPGCGDYLALLKDLHSISWDTLNWGFCVKDDILIGPVSSDVSSQHQQVIMNSANIEANAELVNLVEKRPWRSGSDIWRLYKCKVCHLWLFAITSDERRVAYLMNVQANSLKLGLFNRSSKLSVPVLSKIKL
jgi:serine/threonine protein kinase